MKFLPAIILAALMVAPTAADARKPPPQHANCKVVSRTSNPVGPGGVMYYPDGTSETLTKYRLVVVSQCRGVVVKKTTYYVGF